MSELNLGTTKKVEMSISYRNIKKTDRIIEPLFQIDRVKFKSPRNSLAENLETNLLQIDFSRIINELDLIDGSILDNVKYFTGDISDYTDQAKLDDGISYQLSDLQLLLNDATPTLEIVQIDTTNKLSGKLSRLFHKVTILENGN